MEKSLARVGGTCSILLGVSYIVGGVAYVLTPAEQMMQGTEKFVPSYLANPTPFTLLLWAFALGALLAFAAVPAVSALVGDANDGWLRWTKNLAYLGFAVTAVDYFRELAITPLRADAYLAGNAATKAAIVASESLIHLDPHGWFRFGCIGLWMLVVGIVALRAVGTTTLSAPPGRGALPKVFACLALAGGVLYWVTLAGFVSGAAVLILIGAGLGACIVAPVWYIWAGVILLRRAS